MPFRKRSRTARRAKRRYFLAAYRRVLPSAPGYIDSIQVKRKIGRRGRCAHRDPGLSNSLSYARKIRPMPAKLRSGLPAKPTTLCAIAHSICRQKHLLPALSEWSANPPVWSAAPVKNRTEFRLVRKVPEQKPAHDSQTFLVALTRQ